MSKVDRAVRKIEKDVLWKIDPVSKAVGQQKDKYWGKLKDSMVPEMPEMPAAPEAIDTEGPARQRAAAAEEERRRRLASGRGSTIITGAQGVTGSANIGRKTLTGQ